MISLDGMQLHELLDLRHRVDSAIANASPSNPLTEEERTASMISAIKSVRERLGMSLLEAREYVEIHRKERYVPGM